MKKHQSKRQRRQNKLCISDDGSLKSNMFQHLAVAPLRETESMQPLAKRRKRKSITSILERGCEVDKNSSPLEVDKVKKRKKRKMAKATKSLANSNVQDLKASADCHAKDTFQTNLDVVLREGSVLPVAGFRQAAEALIQQVYHIAARCFYPRLVSVRPFGSLAQDTCISGSDVDISVFFLDGPEPMCRAKSSRLLRNLGREMRRPPATKSLRVIEEILEATVPILKVRSLGSQSLDADISFGSRQQTSCDEVVRSILEKEVIAQRCVLLIKYWAQREAVNKAFHGFPSSFSWVLLTIFYLQREGALPCKHEPARARSQKCLQELLAGFFSFCMSAELSDRWRGISVARGNFRKLKEPAQVLFIEVPGEPSHNAARCLRPEQWERVLQKANKALSSLATGTADSFFRTLMNARMEKGHERLASPWSDSDDSAPGHFSALDDIEDF